MTGQPRLRVEVSLVYIKIWCRLSTFIEHHLQLNLGFRSNNFVFIGEGFSLNLDSKRFFCSQEMDSVLIQVSQKIVAHQRILYIEYTLNAMNLTWSRNRDEGPLCPLDM